MNDFISDFRALLLSLPRYNLKQVGSENCDYADTAVRSKNCYYSFGVFYSEDVYFARYSRKCTSCSGVTFCVGCQWCTECIDCENCYSVEFCQDCQNCSESRFCYDCYGCKNCFGCVGLHQKQYYLFNQPLSEAEYKKALAAYSWQTSEERQRIKDKVDDLRKLTPTPAVHQFSCEDCFGDHLVGCKNCFRCHESFALEDCFFCIETNGNKRCCDLTVCFESEWCYTCIHSPLNYNCNFLFHCDYCSDSEFCAFSKNLKNCFGCVYLQDKEYHILNQAVPPSEYKQRVEELKNHLVKSGNYNLLPYFLSDYEQHRLQTETDSVIQSNIDVSGFENLGDLCMSVSEKLKCKSEKCGKEFLVIASEAHYYKDKHLPLPDHCPACRHKQRMALRSERQLYRRECQKCTKTMFSVYPETAPYKVYCHECFWANIG